MFVTHTQLLTEGQSASSVRHDVRTGKLLPLCRGVYIPREIAPPEKEAQHRLKVLASATRSEYAISHASAAVLHGLPVGWADLSEVHVTRARHGGGRIEGGRRVHAGVLDPRWCTVVDGVLVTTVARTVVDLAKIAPTYIAVGAADGALQLKLCSLSELREALESVRGHPFSRRAQRVVNLCDGRSESPGESRARLVLNSGPLPVTELQISVYDDRGRFVGRADGGYLEYGLLWEYDGQAKYGRLLKPGQTIHDVVLAEKQRESEFTELNWSVLRIINKDFAQTNDLHGRVARAADRARRPGWLPPRGSYEIDPRLS